MEIPTTIVTDVASSTSATIDSLSGLIALLLAIPVAFYILRRILALFPKPRSR